jgi:hypothetical protein
MKRNFFGGQAVDPALGFAQQLERTNRPLSHPSRELRSLDLSNQLSNMPMRSGEMAMTIVGIVMIVVMMIMLVDQASGLFLDSAWETNVHFGGLNSTPMH